MPAKKKPAAKPAALKTPAAKPAAKPGRPRSVAAPPAAVPPAVAPPAAGALPARAAAIAAALDEKKAERLLVLDVRGKSSITDYLIIATATSEPHLRALRAAAEKVLAENGAPRAGSETKPGSGWFVVDAFDAMVHLFLPQQRDAYKLEELWAVGKT